MSIYDYEQAFGALDKTSKAMRNAIQRWFAMYYDGTATDSADTCQRIPYTVVNKLVKAVFGEYKATAETPLGQSILKNLDEKKRLAMQLALVGGSCYLNPCPVGTGFSFAVVPRNQVLIFGVDAAGRPTDMGLLEKSVWGNSYYTLLERRTVDAGGYLTIRYKLYRSNDARKLGAEVPLQNVPAYSALAESYCYQKPVGSVGLVTMKLPMLNCVDGSFDGVAVYAPAEGLIRNIDHNEAQMNGEFSRGESRVFASRDLLDTIDLLLYVLKCGLKYMSDFSLGAVECDYVGMQGKCDLSKTWMEAFKKVCDDRAVAIKEVENYDEELIKKIYEHHDKCSWVMYRPYANVDAFWKNKEATELPPTSSIPVLKQKTQAQLDKYNELYIDK